MHRFSIFLPVLFALIFWTPISMAASKQELDARVDAALQRLYERHAEAKVLADKAVAKLVFPRIMKAGVGVGGELGEGALLVAGQPTRYYRQTALSAGFQLGIQARSEVILFMTDTAYRGFIENDGWEAGIDGSIAIVEFGVGREIDTLNVRDPIIGFVFGNQGLMYNLSIEGAKFWQIKK
jgi:lipid-binding SYLF domain-containing protein